MRQVRKCGSWRLSRAYTTGRPPTHYCIHQAHFNEVDLDTFPQSISELKEAGPTLHNAVQELQTFFEHPSRFRIAHGLIAIKAFEVSSSIRRLFNHARAHRASSSIRRSTPEGPPIQRFLCWACHLHVFQGAGVHVEYSHRHRLSQHLILIELSPEARQNVVVSLLLFVRGLAAPQEVHEMMTPEDHVNHVHMTDLGRVLCSVLVQGPPVGLRMDGSYIPRSCCTISY